MPMLRFLFRKMWNTRWLTLSTLVGLIMAVAFTTSIPMYSDGALKRVVGKTLEEKSDGLPAGSVMIRYQASGSDRADLNDLKAVDAYIQTELPKEITFPHEAYVRTYSIRGSQISPVDPTKVDAAKRRQLTLMAQSGLKERVELTQGSWFSEQPQDGTIEVVMFEEGLYRGDMRIGDTFNYPISGGLGIAPIKIKIVGAYKPLDDSNPYWYQGLEGLLTSAFMSEAGFQDYLLTNKKIPLNLGNWYYAFDLREIQTSQLSGLEKKLDRLGMTLFQLLKNTRVDISFIPLLQEFKVQSVQLQIMLFTLAAPMIAMVFYYIVMNARQSLDRQRTVIAVIRSRGGSTGQIIWIYLLEGLLLGGAALVLGPMLGWFMAKSIGSSSGFLTFVDRKAVPVGVSTEAMLYGAAAVVIAILASVIPAIVFARASIVSYKQKLARSDRKPFWQKWFLDVALLGLVGYGYYLFGQRQDLFSQTGMTTDQLQVHPLLFFIPALSIIALGLFFLRLFPWLLRIGNWLGKRMLPVPVYLTLTQLSRSSTAYYPLMILLILTLGLGIYNASAARTIDLNSTERTLYAYGTDVIMRADWVAVSDELPQNNSSQGGGQGQGQGGQGQGGQGQGGQGQGGQGQGGQGGGQNPGGGGQPGGGNQPPPKLRYIEPPFELFRELEGVEHAARVMTLKSNAVVSGKSIGQGMLMGIDNIDFAEVGWFRKDLLKVHQNNYLNVLGQLEQAVIIPTKLAEKHNIKAGDLMNITVSGQPVEFVVVATVPYWPSQYPDEIPFFIANLEYIYDQAPITPYDVWLKMKDGAKVAPMLEALRAKNVDIATVKDVRNELIIQKKHPARGGVFGILSLGFLVSAFVSLIGYVLYWFFNLSSRVVQFGVLRAMGLSRRQLTGMLLLEQIFTAGLAIALGFGIGKLTSYLFLPFLQTAENVKTQVPPFRVIFDSRDTSQLYIVVAVMMLTGASLLFLHIRRLRVHQAVKLGEEK
ncbi:putative ABC transport system permease protein [Paenibacillus sp. UNCCL117]|uniref:ABC transporter permease n=1 Tax=unclassified Paenibacillus TaxID=185978 RepID=UPI00088F7654|nr:MULTISPECIES: ABC transporter permease [unclassified Paenibacillus]SDC76372.1 putative ABC transport system permease protein [Paenibacillus sp. cl123]SFW25576.1 putative ABC transport system permease protein [Paenibacillus sp. UNCCL117]